MLGLGLSLTTMRGGGAAPDPWAEALALITSTKGWALDPADLSTLWDDSARTVPLTLAPAALAAIDSVSNPSGYFGQPTGANEPSWTGTALSFTSASNHFLLTSTASLPSTVQSWLNGVTGWTICMKIRPSGAAQKQLFQFSTDLVATNTLVGVTLTSAGTIVGTFRRVAADAAVVTVASVTALVAGQDYVLTFRGDCANGPISLRINGVAEVSGGWPATMPSLGSTASADVLAARIGRSFANTFPYAGLIARVMALPYHATGADLTTLEAGVSAGPFDYDGAGTSFRSTSFTLPDQFRWSLSGLGLGETGVYDASRNKTIIAYLTEEPSAPSYIHVVEFDHATGVISDPVTVGACSIDNDDHIEPNMILLSNGHYCVAYGSHNTTQDFAYSTAAGSIAAWTNIAGMPAGTYPKMVDQPNGDGTGTMYMYFREPDPDYGYSVIPVTYLANGAMTKGTPVNIVESTGSDGRIYATFTQRIGTDNEFVFSIANQDDSARTDIFYVRHDPVTNDMTNYDGSMTLAAPITYAEAILNYMIYETPVGGKISLPHWARDNSDRLHVVFAMSTATGEAPIYHMYENGSGLTTPAVVRDAVVPILETTYDYHYLSGYKTGPTIVCTESGIRAVWPTGFVTGFERGGNKMRLGEWNGSGWRVNTVANGPLLGAFQPATPIRGGRNAMAFALYERKSDDSIDNLPLIFIGTTTPTWDYAT